MYLIFLRTLIRFSTMRKWRILANRYGEIGPHQNHIHISPRTVAIYSHANWTPYRFVTFKESMNGILIYVKWKFAKVYFDDIVIFSETSGEHVLHFQKLLSLLGDTSAILKLMNVSFSRNPSINCSKWLARDNSKTLLTPLMQYADSKTDQN